MSITVKDLKEALNGVPDDLIVALGSSTGVIDEKDKAPVVIDGAGRVMNFICDTYVSGKGYEREDYFAIMANYAV